jgi:AraC family transcriptional regulator, exoenzyme S synthesis regulatory protein ExsA
MEQANLIYTCYDGRERTRENLVEQHTLTRVISGASEAFFNGGEVITQTGGFRFMRKNTLAKFTKHPDAGHGYKVLSVVFDNQSLLDYSRQFHPGPGVSGAAPVIPNHGPGIVNLPATPLLTNFFNSLTPYLDDETKRFQQISKIKVMEAISILVDLDEAFTHILFDFAPAGKLDLESYMLANFRYHLSSEEFARLTGRSISTFKRDFEKVFGTTPFEWLKARRLEEAHFLLTHEKRSPGDAAFLAGFVNYSHFSRLFKEAYKKAPSELV